MTERLSLCLRPVLSVSYECIVAGFDDLNLTINTDMATVVKAMAQPDSGLEIRDRMWLKITIPNAFIGEYRMGVACWCVSLRKDLFVVQLIVVHHSLLHGTVVFCGVVVLTVLKKGMQICKDYGDR